MRYEQIGRYLSGTVWPKRWKWWGWLVVLAGLGWGATLAKGMSAPENVFGKLPLYFVENRGQTDSKAVYHTLGGGDRTYFTATGVWLAQTRTAKREADPTRFDPAALRRAALHHDSPQRWALKLEFLGAREVTPQASAPTGATANYFRGKPEQWRTGLATYRELVYPGLWPGIDLHYGGDAGRPKSTFMVAPGADPKQIRLAWHGAERVALADAGRLRVETPLGIIEEERPVAWQERDGRRVPVAARYALESDSAGGWRYGFEVGEYDPALPLVIDPITLGYAGFLGGGGYDYGSSIAVDKDGATYITGYTDSGDFPTSVGAMGGSFNGYTDAFIVKVKPDGSGLAYASFLGGTDSDAGFGIAVDDAGAAYVTGGTWSSDFPVVGGLGALLRGHEDVFVAKVKPDGSGLVYAGFLGGTGERLCGRPVCWEETGFDIAVDSAGAAYVTGTTGSSDFPVVGGLGASLRGHEDAFVAKVKPDGSGLVYAGFVGGTGEPCYSDYFCQGDSGYAIAVDGAGAAYVTGQTFSSDFPVVGGLGVSLKGIGDAFVVKVKPDGSGLVYAGLLGGTGDGCYRNGCLTDSGFGIAVDSASAAYITGVTYSSNFPTVGELGSSLKGIGDAFVAKVKPDGSGLAYVGLLGGAADESCYLEGCTTDSGFGIAVDGVGAAYVTGETYSSDFPTVGGLGAALKGWGDTFVAKVKPDGSGLAYASFLGGSGHDAGAGIAVDSAGAAYIVGNTSSNDFPVAAGPDLSYNGGDYDAFVVKIVETAVPAPPIAVIDHYLGYIDQSLIVAAPGVLRNDLNSDDGTLTASVVGAPGHGALRLDADGGFIYTPNRDGGGTDSFSYKANNSAGDSAPAIVTLELMHPPGAVRDRYDYGIWTGGSGLGNVLANDINIIEGVTTAAIKKHPRHGTLALEPDGDFTYTPDSGYWGRDSFTYVIKYGSATSKPARVIFIMRRS